MTFWSDLFFGGKNHFGRILGGKDYVTISIRNDLFPAHLRQVLTPCGTSDEYPEINLTAEKSESVAAYVSNLLTQGPLPAAARPSPVPQSEP